VDVSVTDDRISLTAEDCAEVSLTPDLVGEGALSVQLQLRDDGSIQPIVAAGAGGGTFHALALSGALSLVGEESARVWRQGYQSWWWAGVVDPDPISFTETGLPEVGGDGGGTSAPEETTWSSWWVGLSGRADGASLLMGALSATTTRFYTAFSEEEAWAVWGGRDEWISLEEGQTLALDPLWLDVGEDAFGLHRTYAQRAAEHVGVEPHTTEPQVGWATWYIFYEDVTEEQVRANLDVAVNEDMNLFQIDDGWQKSWGDWTANERFPSGMATLAADIADAGLTPGLWMAPLYVDITTDTYIENPDWWVLDEQGDPLVYSNFGANTYAVLDVTHPDAAVWLADLISAKVAEGWTYLKLDFLYAGAQAGQRHADVTAMEAYHIGMEIMRTAAQDAWILACGAPMLPSLGYADSYRTGADIAFTLDQDPRREYLRWQARATAGRSWQNGIWWWIDPDQILVRDPFTDIEVSGSIVANVVSGGVWLLGDDLTDLPGSRLDAAMNPDLLALRGLESRPRNPLSFVSGLDAGPLGELADPNDNVPIEWRLEDGTTALLNLSDEAITVDGPGGTELLSGATSEAGPRTLQPGQGEVWQ